jgi:hypothetical protein
MGASAMTTKASLLSSSQIPEQYTDHSTGKPRISYRLRCGIDACGNVGEWASPDGGWTKPHRVLEHFRRRGWGIGRDRAADWCPACLMAKREAAKLKPPPQLRMLANFPPVSKPLAKRRLSAHTPAPLPPRVPGRPLRATMTRGFTVIYNAKTAAEHYLTQMGVASPEEGRDFRLIEQADGWGWDRIPQEEQPMTPNNGNGAAPPAAAATLLDEIIEDIARDIGVVHAEPPSQATREQRQEVREFIERNYDEDAQRWRGDLSDRKAGEQLDKPRIWITEGREMGGYGPDRNEVQAQAAEAEARLSKRVADLEGSVRDLVAMVARDVGLIRADLAKLRR